MQLQEDVTHPCFLQWLCTRLKITARRHSNWYQFDFVQNRTLHISRMHSWKAFVWMLSRG